MRLNKNNVIFSAVVILIIILLFLPRIIDRIPSKEVKLAASIIVCLLILIYIIFETYRDITKKQYTTNTYIVLTDILQILAFAVLSYISFKSYNKKNIEEIFKIYNARIVSELILFAAILLRNFLRSQRFEKK